MEEGAATECASLGATHQEQMEEGRTREIPNTFFAHRVEEGVEQEFTHIYAYPRNRSTTGKWLAFVVTVTYGNFVAGAVTMTLVLQTGWGKTFWREILGGTTVFFLGDAVFLVILLKSYGMERLMERIRDYRWDDPRREFRLVTVALFSSLMHLVVYTLSVVTILAVLLPVTFIIASITLMILPIPPGNEAFQSVLLASVFLEVILFAGLIRYAGRVMSRRRERYTSYAKEIVDIPNKTTAVTGDFMGMTGGRVLIVREETVLHCRSGAITGIVHAHPFLLVRDEKDDVFLWERRTVWTFHGMMEYQEDTFVFNPEVRRRLKVTMLKRVGEWLVFKADGTVHGTRDISSTIRPEKLGEDGGGRTVEDVFRTGERWVMLYMEQSRRFIVFDNHIMGLEEGTEVEITDVIYTLSSDRVEVWGEPNCRIAVHELVGSQLVKKVRSDNQNFYFIQVVIEGRIKTYATYLFQLSPSGRLHRWRTPAEWRLLGIEKNEVWVEYNRKIFKIHLQTLPTVERREFGDKGTEQSHMNFRRTT